MSQESMPSGRLLTPPMPPGARHVEVSDDLTSQSRHSLLLQGSPPSAKLLIPLERRDVRVVEGARLESESGDVYRGTPKHLFAQSVQRLPAAMPLDVNA